jgi:hypothetical protein
LEDPGVDGRIILGQIMYWIDCNNFYTFSSSLILF